MRNHTFVHLNYKNYLDRIKPTLVGPALFVGFLIAIAYMGTNSAWVVIGGIALFCLYIKKHMKWGRIYITEIEELPENKLHITYMDKNEVKEYTADKKSISIERSIMRFRLSADKEQCLVVKDAEKGFTLTQHTLGDWEDEKIDEVINDWQPDLTSKNLSFN